VLFLGKTYAGHAARLLNLQSHVASDHRIDTQFRSVTGWKQGGWLERSPALPRGLKARLRAVAQASTFASIPRPDAIWLSTSYEVLPYLWAQAGPLRRPVILDLDATERQLDAMAPWYRGRPPARGLRKALMDARVRILRTSIAFFTPWSQWAARGLLDEGVPAERLAVMPPGVDLDLWKPADRERRRTGPLRVLFVGGNFARKGGDILLDVARIREDIEVHVVTRDAVEASSRVSVHSAAPNSPELLALYASADVFVLPTRAECFGIAAVEAMAAGLPVIMSNVGGAGDIVEDGVTGHLITATARELAEVLEAVAADRERLAAMGRCGRERAERLFDGARNDRAIVDLALRLVAAGGR
jgi:glycosyltransferase involved in cell wall biosynthesis